MNIVCRRKEEERRRRRRKISFERRETREEFGNPAELAA